MSKSKNWGYCIYCDEHTTIAARSMCWKHYARWRRVGDPTKDPDYSRDPMPKSPCSVDVCNEDTRTKGFCGKHYQRWKRHGNTDTVLIRGGVDRERLSFNKNQCIVHDCDKDYSTKELCHKHYVNYHYHKQVGNVKTIFDYLRLRKDNTISLQNENNRLGR